MRFPVAAILLCAAIAHAEEPSFEALGQASIVAGDTVRARERALEEAFRQAVEQAVATLLEPKVIAERASQLKLSVYPKARGYVTTYRVLQEGEQGGLFQVRVAAQVAVGRLARAVNAPQAVKPALAPRPKAVVCLVEKRAPAGWAPSSLEQQLVLAVGARGVEVTPLAGHCWPVKFGQGDDRVVWPDPDDLDDVGAGKAARDKGAQGAIVGTLAIVPAGTIRGTPLLVAQAKVSLHLVEADGRPSAVSDGTGEASGTTFAAAADGAARAALDRAARTLGPHIGAKWPTTAASGAGVILHVSGVERYAQLQSLLRVLQAIPGVGAVSPRRFEASGIDVMVHTAAPAPSLAAALARNTTDGEGVRFTAEPMGDLEIRVVVVPAPPAPQPSLPLAPPG